MNPINDQTMANVSGGGANGNFWQDGAAPSTPASRTPTSSAPVPSSASAESKAKGLAAKITFSIIPVNTVGEGLAPPGSTTQPLETMYGEIVAFYEIAVHFS